MNYRRPEIVLHRVIANTSHSAEWGVGFEGTFKEPAPYDLDD